MKDIEKARQGLSDAETGGIATEGFTVPDMGEYALLPGNPRRISLPLSQMGTPEMRNLAIRSSAS